jgi:hypothetical protein
MIQASQAYGVHTFYWHFYFPLPLRAWAAKQTKVGGGKKKVSVSIVVFEMCESRSAIADRGIGGLGLTGSAVRRRRFLAGPGSHADALPQQHGAQALAPFQSPSGGIARCPWHPAGRASGSVAMWQRSAENHSMPVRADASPARRAARRNVPLPVSGPACLDRQRRAATLDARQHRPVAA